jgi:hypothetical protein
MDMIGRSTEVSRARPELVNRVATAEQLREPGPVVLDDLAATVAPGQMRHSHFLAGLEQAVAAAAEPALASVGRTARDCPFIRAWFAHYRGSDAEHLRRALARHAPETRLAASADEYLAIVGDRARRAAEIWASTGRIEWNSREVMAPDDPRGVQAELGPGQALESGIRGRAQSTLQENFSRVRVHTGGPAAQLTRQFGMRAFAIGEDIAFAPGEYRPGTPAGDAMIAHELAHVVQQKAARQSAPQVGESPELERDANQAATGAVMSIWGPMRRAVGAGALKVKPALRTGLRIQGCKDTGLRFSSSGFDLTATPPPISMTNTTTANGTTPGLELGAGDVTSSATVHVRGGTDQEARDWQAGYIQTVFSANRVGEYRDATGANPQRMIVSLPGPTRDGIPGDSPAPWYEGKRVVPYLLTNANPFIEHGDHPRQGFPWQIPNGTLAATSGGDTFGTWLIVRQKSTGNPRYLNWATWTVDWSGTANFQTTSGTGAAGGGAKVTGKGEGKGANEPVLVGPIANTQLTATIV